MFLPLGWALNPTLVPSFVATPSNMHERQSSNSDGSPPGYIAFERNAPPAYPLDDLSEILARPKEAHTHLPRDETRAGASTPPLAEDYVHIQNGLSFDVEANMAAASVRMRTSWQDLDAYATVQTDQVAPRINNHVNNANHAHRPARLTCLDIFVNIFLLGAVIFWPLNTLLGFFGEVCHSITPKILFCGIPPTTIFFIWTAMLQKKGYWATSRKGKTEGQYKRLRQTTLSLTLAMAILTAVVLWQAMFRTCMDGCANGTGDGEHCVKDRFS